MALVAEKSPTSLVRQQNTIAMPSATPDKLITQLVQEAQLTRGDEERQWDTNIRRYDGDHNDFSVPKGLLYVTMNLTRRAIDAQAATMFATRPQVNITPRETNAKALWFIPPHIGAQLANMPEVQGLTASQMLAGAPVLDFQVPILQNIVPLEQLDKVDDKAVADAGKHLLDVVWDADDWDARLADGGKNCLTFGVQDFLVEWDGTLERVLLRQLNPKAVWIDPTAERLEDAHYAIIAQLLSLDAAMHLFPQRAAEIKANHDKQGSISSVQESSLPWAYQQQLQSRKMVMMLTAWIRYQHPMQVQLPDGTPRETTIRQITTVADVPLYDGPTLYRDIPLVRFVNVPRPHSIYGDGEPKILDPLQQAINRTLSNAINHMRYMSNPQQIITERTWQATKAANQQMHSHPGRALIVPDDLVKEYGGNLFNMYAYPPQLNASYHQMLQTLISLFNETANRSDVTRGVATPDAQSGKAIMALQAAASEVVGYRAIYVAQALQRLAKLAIGMVVDFLPEESWPAWTDKHSWSVIQALRARGRSITLDANVQMVPSRGSIQQAKEQKALMMRQMGALDLETFLERMNEHDPKAIIERLATELRQAQAALAAQAENAPQPAAA